ncbi:MAG: hypothetical protein JXB88_17905, partial [Spirochaetales bacterium]|nr:hypothetical protein [Spirochaetales bacterium]
VITMEKHINRKGWLSKKLTSHSGFLDSPTDLKKNGTLPIMQIGQKSWNRCSGAGYLPTVRNTGTTVKAT